MCRSILLGAAAAMTLSVAASNLDKMAFECNDGKIYVIAADNLSISYAADKLMASNGTETLTFNAAEVSRFFFSDGQSGVEDVIAGEQHFTVYNLQGIKVGEFDTFGECAVTLAPGIYISKSGNKTSKFEVK